ncbi:hypothetical protein SAMN05444392_103290 [Seinonella peptonophila]|uniref:Uncharacterized protein n=1 Tax=Seinonella peptonophila TaxID=112248 RepID=A0A1M4WN84_9BACL|nr:hypothetical protein [Seinonella peptonophila]SHE82432.1 hypothetical protein SAMN05444392_103290 [Seinonella peptonophila]
MSKHPVWLLLLQPIKKNLLKQHFWNAGKIGFGIGCLLGLCWLLLARALPLLDAPIGAGILILIGTVGGILYALFRQPSWEQTIRWADEYLKLEDRLITGWELSQKEAKSPLFHLQEEEAQQQLRDRLATDHALPFHWFQGSEKYWLPSLLLILLTLIFIPNPMQKIAIQQQAEQKLIEKQWKKIVKQEQQVSMKSQLSPQVKQELKKELTDLQEKLAKSSKKSHAAMELAKSEERLRQLQEQMKKHEQTNEKMKVILSKYPQLKGIQSQLEEQQDQQKREQAIQQALAKLSPTQRSELANELGKLGQEAANSSDQTEQQFGKALQQKPMEKGIAAAAKSQQQQQQDQQTIDETQQTVAASKTETLEQNQQTASTKQTPKQNGTQKEGNSTEQANGQSSGQDSQGQQGKGASGGNQKGDSTDGKQTEQQQSSSYGKGAGSRNWIYAPKQKTPGTGPIIKDKGPLGKQGVDQQTGQSPTTEAGSLIPYDQVFANYQNEARQAIDQGAIPSEWKDFVKDYFSSIEP